ncbi:MAG: GGDEF domain-containing protein [Acidobacteria bacterium]|nr:GGDEF domain-containing protein [Acidobacteriota bacterium]
MSQPPTLKVTRHREDSADHLPACVVQVYGPELGKRTELGASEVVAGRDADCGIPIDLPTVSRRHARFFSRGAHTYLADLGSTNGTLLNQKDVEGEVLLRSGDLVKIGGAILKFLEGGNIEARYHEEIYRLTINDGLTLLANKRHLLETLEKEVQRARRHTRALSVVMADIDHFKRINDEHGHLAGDAVLRAVADVFRREARKDELVARYGGEEFAVVLADAGLEGARDGAERIRAAVANERITFAGALIPVTISAGAASLQEGETGLELIARADARLYAAKRAGRNRVVAAADP